MKKSVTFFLLMLIASVMAAQSPLAFKYQAVARDGNGDPVINQDIAVKISILSGSESGPAVYSELHEIPTNQMGLFTLEIGNATFVLSGNFTEIGWGVNSHFLKTEIDITGGSNYQLMGVSQLLSVPYALYANEAGNAQNYTGGTGINVSNGVISNTAPDQNVTIAPGNGISTSGNYPNFMVTNTNPDQNVTLTSGYGISTSGVYPNFTITNAKPNATHTGDASGTTDLTVTGIQGRNVSNTAPTLNQVYKWDGTRWMPSTLDPYTAGTGIEITNNVVSNTAPNATHTGDATGGSTLTVVKIQGRSVSSTTPTSNQVLQWNGSTWAPTTLATPSEDWKLTGNSGTSPTTNFIGTTDNVALKIKVNNQQAGWLDPSTNANTSFGYQALKDIETGKFNSALGYYALQGNTSGNYNTATGTYALFTNTEGDYNSANGYTALYKNTTGSGNTASGYRALYNNTTGYSNVAFGSKALYNNNGQNNLVAVGDSALYNNGTGAGWGQAIGNTAVGSKALFSNNTGYYNTSVGNEALYNNTFGDHNTAHGFKALYTNGLGATYYWECSDNTAIGSFSLFANTTGSRNTATGSYSLNDNTIGEDNTANGSGALSDNTTGNKNTATGTSSLRFNSTGNYNTANGSGALYFNTTGYSNVAVGAAALYKNTVRNNLVAIGDSALFKNGQDATLPYHSVMNTAVGSKALYLNTTGYNNTALGSNALYSNSSGARNTAFGIEALFSNTDGHDNIGIGCYSLQGNSSGHYNMAFGNNTLTKNTTGNDNTAVGHYALLDNLDGNDNSAFGEYAMFKNTSGIQNTAVGKNALMYSVSGNNNTAVGYSALDNNNFGINNTAIGAESAFFSGALNNTTCLGYQAGNNANVSNRVAIGNTSVTWIGGQVNWSIYSDERIKENVKEDVAGLEFISRLRPVTYNLNIHKQNEMFKKEGKDSSDWPEKYDIENIRMTGFLAQEVEKAAQETGYDFSGVEVPENGGLYSLRYSDFVVPLVKAVQEQQALIDHLQTTNEKLRTKTDELQRQIDELKTLISGGEDH